MSWAAYKENEPGGEVTQRYYQDVPPPVVGAFVAACLASIALASCAGGNALNGHPAPLISINAPDSTATPVSPGPAQPTASPPGTSPQGAAAGPSSSGPVQLATSTPGTSSHKVATKSSGPTQPATSQSYRPYRPNSVIGRLFNNTLHPPLCVPVAAGSSDTAFAIQRFVARALCFTGLDTSVSPSIVITTPEGSEESVTLTPNSREWDYPLIPVPGQGAEASLGEYSFRVTTPIPGAASASPTAGFVNTTGQFTVMPESQPAAEVGDSAVPEGNHVFLPAGSQLYIWFSGFTSFSIVYVSLYGPGPGAAREYPLLADLPAVKTDPYGEGTVTWAIPPDAAPSEYLIWVDPPPTGCPNPCMGFTVIR
jgi:hypothetical protein